MAHHEGSVPVYLPDGVVVGRAVINTESGTATIRIQADSNLMELFKEDLVGLSIMYMDKSRVEDVQNKGEQTDG